MNLSGSQALWLLKRFQTVNKMDGDRGMGGGGRRKEGREEEAFSSVWSAQRRVQDSHGGSETVSASRLRGE